MRIGYDGVVFWMNALFIEVVGLVSGLDAEVFGSFG